MFSNLRLILIIVVTVCNGSILSHGNNRCLTTFEEVNAKRVVEDDGKSLDITFELSRGITQRLTTRIMKIFIVEVLGYPGVKLIEESNNYDYSITDREDFERFVENIEPHGDNNAPRTMINMEMWMPVQVDDPLYFENFHVKDCGSIGPPGYFGWFIPRTLWRSNISETWHMFQDKHISAELFDVDDDTFALIKSYALIKESTLNEKNNHIINNRYYCTSNFCNEGIYTPQRCMNSTIKCAMLLSGYPEVTSFVIKHIEEYKLFVKVAWVGPNLDKLTKRIMKIYNSTRNDKSLVILHRTPSDVIPNDNDFVSITFPKCRPKSITDICKYEDHRLVKLVWDRLEHIADKAYQSIKRTNFNTEMYSNLIKRWNNKNEISTEDDIACDWIKDNLNYTLREWKPPGKSKDTLVIGGIFPMTGDSYKARSILVAAGMAVKAINKNESLLGDYSLEVWGSDGQCKSDMVLKSFIDYILNHYKNLIGILGPACSETIEPLIGLSKQYSTMIISYSAEGSSFDDRDKYPYFYRTIGENIYYKYVYRSIFEKMNWQRVAALTEDGQKYTEYISLMQHHLRNYNIIFVDNAKYPRNRDDRDDVMYRFLENLKKKRARIIIADMYNNEDARQVMCAAYRLNMTAYEGYVWFLPLWLSPNWWARDVYHKNLNTTNDNDIYNNSSVKSILCTKSQMLRSVNGHFGISHAYYASDDSIMQENKTVREWRNEYEADCIKNNQTPSDYAGYAYDATWTYAYAMDKLIEENESYVLSLRSKDTADRLTKIISETDFQGVSGRIKFIDGASRISSVEIIQHIDKKNNKIGIFHPNVNETKNNKVDGGYLQINMSAIVWLNQGNQIPDDGSEPETKCVLHGFADYLNVSCEVAIVIVNIIGFGLLGILLIVGFVIVKRKYDQKVRLHERYMKSLGIDLLQTDTSGLDKWEIPRECVVINRKLGEGAFGTVYGGEAFFTEKGWLAVAVKTLKVGSSTEEKLDFLSEVEVMKRFEHKNIIKLLGVCIKCEPVYTVMEFMLYGDLKTYLLARRHLVNDRNYEDYDEISSKKLTAMALDVARALSYLAQLKYVHRDIASRNCLVNAQRVVKLGDFGMTRPMYENDYYKFNRKGMLPVRWMAPESLGLGIFTPASDVWSYGVLLYEIITFGSFPFQGLSNNEVLEHVKCGNTINIPSGIKGPLENLIRSCWTIDHKSRPKAPEIVDFLATNPRLLSPCLDVPLASVQLEHTGQIDMQLPEKFRKFSVSLNSKQANNLSQKLNTAVNNRLVKIGMEDMAGGSLMNTGNNSSDPNFRINSRLNDNPGGFSSSTIIIGDSSSSRLPLLHNHRRGNLNNDNEVDQDRSKYVELQRSINPSNDNKNQFLARYVNIQPGYDLNDLKVDNNDEDDDDEDGDDDDDDDHNNVVVNKNEMKINENSDELNRISLL